jgi:hypothetical protein
MTTCGYSHSIRIIESIAELNKECSKRSVYIVLANQCMWASTIKYDMEKWLDSDDNLYVNPENFSDVFAMFGFVLDIKNLPVSLPSAVMKSRKLWLMSYDHPNVMYEEYESLKDVVEDIERFISEGSEIEDMAIVVGYELAMTLHIPEAGNTILTREVYSD